MGCAYEAVDTPQAEQISPYADQTFNFLQSIMGDVSGGQGQYSPSSVVNEFLGQAPMLQDLARSATGPFAQTKMDLAKLQAMDAKRLISGQLADMNLLRSSSGLEFLGKGMGTPFAQALSDISGRQMDLEGSLLGGGLQSMGSQFASTAGLMGSGMSTMGAFSPPEFQYPILAYEPSLFEKIIGGLGLAADTAGSVAALFPGQTSTPTT